MPAKIASVRWKYNQVFSFIFCNGLGSNKLFNNAKPEAVKTEYVNKVRIKMGSNFRDELSGRNAEEGSGRGQVQLC